MSGLACHGALDHAGDPPSLSAMGDTTTAPRISTNLPPTIYIDSGKWNGEIETFRVWWIELID